MNPCRTTWSDLTSVVIAIINNTFGVVFDVVGMVDSLGGFGFLGYFITLKYRLSTIYTRVHVAVR